MRLPSSPPAELSALTQREVVVGGQRISYTEAGPAAAGPPMLMLHGAVFAGNLFWWEAQAALAPHVRTIAPDFPGWGASDKPRHRPFDMEVYREFILGFLDALGLEKVAIAGHSMGGLLGSGFALMHPERVESLTTVASPPAWADFEIPRLFRPFLVPGLGEFMMATTAMLGTEHPMGIRRFYEGLFHDHHRIPAPKFRSMLEANCAVTTEAGHRHAFLTTFRHSHQHLGPAFKRALREKLAASRFPKLLIAGKQDPLFPLDLIEAGATHAPGARLVVLDRCGHFPTWEQPEQVIALLREMALETPAAS